MTDDTAGGAALNVRERVTRAVREARNAPPSRRQPRFYRTGDDFEDGDGLYRVTLSGGVEFIPTRRVWRAGE